jgi:exonuclease III
MKIASLNLRGWGGSAKRRRLRSFIQKGAFEVCLFQETKKSSFDDYEIHSLWGHKDVGWVFQESTGMSGGLLIIWNSTTFKVLSSFSGHGFLCIKVERDGVVLHIVNVYSPCSLVGKKQLGADLLAVKQSSSDG